MTTLTPGRLLGALALLLFTLPAMAQSTPIGVWRTIDDETGEPKSHVRIYERGGKLFGDVVQLLPTASNPEAVCSPCADEFEGGNLQGVVILRDMAWDAGDQEFSGGRITDPKNGRTYRAYMKLEGPDRLRVRGFLGVRALGRTQVWRRAP